MDGRKEASSTGRFSPHMTETVRVAQGPPNQECTTPSGSPTGLQGPKHVGYPLLISQMHYQVDWKCSSQGLELMALCHAGPMLDTHHCMQFSLF